MANEPLCVVDKNDNIVRSDSRSAVHNSKMWHRGVHIFLYDERGRMLVQLRSSKKDKFPNTLDCISEHNMFGENYGDAAKRCLKEELDISSKLKFLIHFRMVYGPKDYMVCKLFECTHDGKIKANKSEVSGIYFFSKNELLDMINKNPQKLTPWFCEMLKWKFRLPNKLEILYPSATT